MTIYNLILQSNGFTYTYTSPQNQVFTFHSLAKEYYQDGSFHLQGTTTETVNGNETIYSLDQHEGFIRKIVNGNQQTFTYEGTFPLLKRRDIPANIYTLTGVGDIKKGQIGNYYAVVDVINTNTPYNSFRIFGDEGSYNNSLNAGNGQESNYLSWIGLDISMIQQNVYITNPSLIDGTIFKITNNLDGTLTIDDSYNPNNVIPQPEPTPVDSNISTGMGANYYEEDLATNVKKYFAEAFKFDGTQFEMDGDRVIGIKQSFLDTIAVDLTHIVNTSIRTSTLEADSATINDTLTALGIDVTGLLRARGVDVGVDGLTIEDAQGHKHKLHLGN